MRSRFLLPSSFRTFRSSLLLLFFVVVGFLLLGLAMDYSLLRRSWSYHINKTELFRSSPPKQYIIVMGLRGLNNYVLDLSNAGMIAKLSNRILLIHPCVQNEHTSTHSFKYDPTNHQLIKNFNCKTDITFPQLYRVNQGVSYEMVTESHPVWNYTQPIKYCGLGKGEPEAKQMGRLMDCMNKTNNSTYVFFASGLFYLGTKNVFDFSEHVYRLVNTVFDHRKINLQQTMVVHVRLGDYDSHCKHLQLLHNDCYVLLPELEALLLQVQKKFDVKNVMVMTNGKLPRELLSRNGWTSVSDIIGELSVIAKDEPMDGNMRVVLEMATGVLAKYFVGNRYSSVSGSIAALRERYHSDFVATTTSVSALMGLRNESTYFNYLDIIKERGVQDY